MITPLVLLGAFCVAISGFLLAYARRIERRPESVAKRVHSLNRALFGAILVFDVALGIVSGLFLEELKRTAAAISERSGIDLWTLAIGSLY